MPAQALGGGNGSPREPQTEPLGPNLLIAESAEPLQLGRP
jgi:hypothetical protein